MRRITILTIGLLFLLSIGFVSAQGERHVWAFYLGFWAGSGSWDAQAGVLSDYSALGAYDSRDPGIAGTHIDQAMSAGINGFVVSWFGVGDGVTTTPALNNLLDRAAQRGFGVAAAVDVFASEFNRTYEAMVGSLNFLVNDRVHHPGYLRYQGRPVIFFAFQNRAGFDSATWLSIRNEVDPNHNTIWIAEGLSGCCLYGGAMDGMYAFNMAWSGGSAAHLVQQQAIVQGSGGLYIPTIHPGWDENLIAAREGRPNPSAPQDRADGQFLSNAWHNAVSINPDIILIVSWNEFIENSHIEPSQVYGSQSLDTLRPLVGAWRSGQVAPPPAGSAAPPPVEQEVPQPANEGGTLILQALGDVNVRAGAGLDQTIIGSISSGVWYTILGEESGWYLIDYGGRTGYVYSEVVQTQIQ